MKWVIGFAVVLALAVGYRLNGESSKTGPNDQAITLRAVATPTPVARKKAVLLDVPFMSQAPNGEWSDVRHQDGCEEAAVLMAMLAVQKTTMTKAEFSEKMKEIWAWEEKTYGVARDTSAADTAERIMGGYFGYMDYEVVDLTAYVEIRNELEKGRIVIVPADGVGLNPNYTAPGPERHMILIRGYDDTAGEFITNDAGTRRGEKFRYKYEKLFNAIRDYPTGDHQMIVGRIKRMIVVNI